MVSMNIGRRTESNVEYSRCPFTGKLTKWYITGGGLPPRKETKKEKQHRLATEKMYSSWSTFNLKVYNVKHYMKINVKQSHKAFNRIKH